MIAALVLIWPLSARAADVTRSDYADLLWTAFGGERSAYLTVPGDKGPQVGTLTREGAFFLLVNKAMATLRDVEIDGSVLDGYTDARDLSPWARGATAYAIQVGIFLPGGAEIRPKQLVTTAEALAWVREARYPLYTFLSTNDFHGAIETGGSITVGGIRRPVGGAAYDMTYVESFRASNPLGTMLLDAGDLMQGPPISNLLFGASIIDVFNHMGYQAATVGNHDFDWGQPVLQERIAQATFPFLLANVFHAGTDTRPEWMVPTAMFTVKGQQIGVIGVTGRDTPDVSAAEDVAGLDFRDAAPVVDQLAAELRAAGADIVAVLAHMPDVYNGVHGELLTLARPGVDLIIAGHSHARFTGRINGVPLIEQYSSGTAIGVSDLRYDRLLRGVSSAALQVVTTYNEGVTPDPAIAALVAQHQAEIAPFLNAVEASTLGPISRTASAAGESPMGNLIADAQRWKGGTQIALTNPGGVRNSLEYASYPHDITYGDLLTVQPFDNKLVTMTLTGAQIYALLEQQFPPAQSTSRVLQVSGIRYAYDASAAPGSRIAGLVLDGAGPIASDATPYTVTVNEFIATGGDQFTVFLGGANVTRIGVSDLEALVEYVGHRFGVPPDNAPIDPAVYPAIEGRVTQATP